MIVVKKKNGKRLGFLLVSACLFTLFFATHFFSRMENPNVVHVYDWYGNLNKKIIEQFEHETGIKVQYDVYDSNEILEAKLLATNSGYDVVFPSASPYVARQIRSGVYQPLDKKLLPYLKNLFVPIVDQMKHIDPHMTYAIPYYWGTLGIALDVDKVLKKIPEALTMGYQLLFNPQNLAKLADCGVSFLEEPVDVFPLILKYLGKDPNSMDLKNLHLAFQYLLKLRPYMRRFTSSRFMNDLIAGDVCIVQAWSGEIQKTQDLIHGLGKNIKYIVPKEGTTLWIDCIAIPKGAPHVKNAHIFINFLLRPDISAQITNYNGLPTIVSDSFQYVHKKLKSDPSVFPPQNVFSKLRLDKPCTTSACQTYDKKRTRLWAYIKLARDKDKK